MPFSEVLTACITESEPGDKVSKYVLAFVIIVVCFVFLQKGCERMRNARWDRWDHKKDQRHERREDKKDDRFWRKDNENSDDNPSEDPEEKHQREKRIFWRRRDT